MLRSALGKVAWVGRTVSMVFGLALVMALVIGAASTAWSATGGNFILGKANGASKVSKLTASVAGPALALVNQSTGAAATALNLNVASGKPPLKVNAAAGTATNLSADELDGKDSSVFLRDAYREQNEDLFGGFPQGSNVCQTAAYTPAYPQTALIDINASLTAPDASDLRNAYLRASYSTDGGATWQRTSHRISPQADIPAGKEAALGYLDAFPLEPGVTYRFAAVPLWPSGSVSEEESSYCQVLVSFINR